MKKITLLFLLVLTATFGFAQNLFTDGTFDDPSAWTIIQQNANNNATATIAGGVATFDDVTQGTWGSEGHVAIYKAFTVAATGWYQFDADVTTDGVNEHWFELYIGTTAPVDGAEYNTADFGAANLLALNAWDCAAYNTYSGSWLATGCKGLDGKIQLDAGTTYYSLIRSGGITWGTGVILDNITLVTTTGPVPEPEPNSGAPVTTYTTVYSLFSDSYTSTAPASWVQGWGQGSVEDFVADSDNIKKYTDLNFQAIDFSSTVDISSYTHIHIDVWTPIDNAVAIKLQDFGLDNTEEYPNADDTEVEVLSTTAQTTETWVGHDIAISDYVGLNTANLGQIQVVLGSAAGGTTGTAYIDNIYFYDAASLGIEDFQIEGLKVYPNPTNNAWNVSTKDQVINSIEVFNIFGSRVLSLNPNALSVNIDATSLTSGVYFTTISTESGIVTKKLIKQ